MPINRFYTPSRGQYISQFVPKELPADLMLKGVLAKQQKYDVTDAAMGEAVTSYKPNALKGEDTRYAKAHKKKLEEFVNNARGEDLASPEFQRRYREFVNEFKNDEGIQKVEAAYAHHQKALARMEEIRKKGGDAEAQEYWDEYQRAYNIYTDENGQGFKGDVSLADNMLKEGQSVQKAIEELFNHVGKDSYQSIAELTGTDLHYSVTNGGVSVGKLNNAAAKQLHNFVNSAAGDQLKARFNMMSIPKTDEEGRPITQAQYLSSLSPEDKKKFEEEQLNYIKGVVTGTGQTFATSEYSTNKSTVMNKQSDRDRADLKNTEILSGTLEGRTIDNPNLTWESQITNLERSKMGIAKLLQDAKKTPGKYNEGTIQAWTAQYNRLNSEIKNIEADKHNKYKEIYKRHLGEVDVKDLNLAKSKVNPKILHLIEREGALHGLLNASPEYKLMAGYSAFKNSEEFHKLSKNEREAVANYMREVGKLKAVKDNVKKNTDKEWKETYYSGTTQDKIKYSGYTTVPKYKGSIAQVEEDAINNVREGYKFYTSDGQLVTLKGNEALGKFTMTGITQENWKGEGYGRVGTLIKKIPKYNADKTQIIGYIEKPITVVATAQNPNREMTQGSYAREYMNTADIFRKNGREDEAKLAERTALSLVNPKLAAKFDSYNESDTFSSGFIPIEGDLGELKVDKNPSDGTWEVTLQDQGRIVSKQTFGSAGEAKHYITYSFGH